MAKKKTVEVKPEVEDIPDLEDIQAEEPTAVEVDPNAEFIYINKSKENLFTESGVCRPMREVILTESQAAKYKGLEKE
jgi:hypothetical protein